MSVAQSLASAFSGSSQVSVNNFGDVLTITAKGTGGGTDYSYSVSETYNSQVFSTPSFSPSSASGNLANGNTGANVPLYQYQVNSYYPNGNLLSYNDSVMGGWSFDYDQLDRLTTASNTQLPGPSTVAIPYPNWSEYFCWAYDAFGNRLQQSESNESFSSDNGSCTSSGSTTTEWASYSAQNQMTQTNAPNVTPYTPSYDAAGDVTQDANNTYLYDADGQLCAVNAVGVGMIGYLYDASGNRVAKGTITSWSCDISQNGFQQTAGYVVDGGAQLTEVDGSNNWKHTNLWLGGKQFGSYDQQGLHFYFNDPLGTRRAQANSAGALEAVYQSLPYGDDLVSSGSDDPTENHFTGYEYDAESGNDFAKARYYGGISGRFISPDPSLMASAHLAIPQSLNLYAYTGNNPVGFIDPTGLSSFGIGSCTLDGAPVACSSVQNNSGVEQCPHNTCNQTANVNGNWYFQTLTADDGFQWAKQNGAIALGAEELGLPDLNSEPSDMGIQSGEQFFNPTGKSTASTGGVSNSRNPGGVSDARMRCETALIGKAATHATATAVGNIKGTWTKLMGGLKAAAPGIGGYGEAAASYLGAGEATTAMVGASLSGVAEYVGSATTVYIVGSGAVDFYKYMVNPMNSCAGIP